MALRSRSCHRGSDRPVLAPTEPSGHPSTQWFGDDMTASATTSPTAQQFVDGALVASARVTESTSPADGSVLDSYADADRAQGAEAVAAARAAFDQSDWSRDRQLRHRVLNEIADGIERRTDDLITMLARENGKVLGEAGFELSLTPS